GQHHHEADQVQHDEHAEEPEEPGRRWTTYRPLRPRSRAGVRGARRFTLVSEVPRARRRGHRVAPVSCRTCSAKSSPRSAYDLYQSNEAQAGDSSTLSPGRARSRADATASAMEVATVVGHTCSNARTTSSAASPMATTARTWSPSRASGARSRPLFCPPAISTTDGSERMAAAAAFGVVAFESSYQEMPSWRATSSMRCGRPRNAVSASWTPATVPP